MVQEFIPILPTQHVVDRLYAEGWVDCPGVKFAALSQRPLCNIRNFTLAQLQQSDGWMWRQDLELTALIFSITDHEFRVHPHLRPTLKQLEAEEVIKIHRAGKSMPRFGHMAIISLVPANTVRDSQ